MRPIEFRGMRADTGEWVYGDLVHNAFDGTSRNIPIGIKPDNSYPIEVIPETVGQFTGRTDINGRKIFEGDKDESGYFIQYIDEYARFLMIKKYGNTTELNSITHYYKVIGTIHDTRQPNSQHDGR